MEHYGGGPIVIDDYDPEWPRLFAEERARIRPALAPFALAVEHVGSTAVPGLAGKPILDILVGVRDLDDVRPIYPPALTALGYTYLPAYEVWLPGELLFRRIVDGRWTQHVHVTETMSPRWLEFIQVRDYLRRHPAVAHDYGELKKELATRYGDDIEGYRLAKRPFMTSLLERARSATPVDPGTPE